MKAFPLEDILAHNKLVKGAGGRGKADKGPKTDGCFYLLYGVWVIKVPSDFNHPGGTKLLRDFLAPTDCAMFFDTTKGGAGHSSRARALMKGYIVGYIAKEAPTYPIGTLRPSTSIWNVSKLDKNQLQGFGKQFALVGFLFSIHALIFYLATMR